ncbi:MAG: XTP/dITP diphosphatase [Candidatus Micrarchaeota archaeon]
MASEILFATSNPHKSEEASIMLSKAGIGISRFPFEHREIRSDSLEDIAREAAEEAYRRCARPVFVEDAGLFIKALDGFPGTYSAWVNRKIGIGGILRLMDGAKDRSAYFGSCIAFHDGGGVRVFNGRCDGAIAEKARGKGGFGYDPIFVPEGHSQTFAQNIELKNNISHRYKSLLEFSRSLDSLR